MHMPVGQRQKPGVFLSAGPKSVPTLRVAEAAVGVNLDVVGGCSTVDAGNPDVERILGENRIWAPIVFPAVLALSVSLGHRRVLASGGGLRISADTERVNGPLAFVSWIAWAGPLRYPAG